MKNSVSAARGSSRDGKPSAPPAAVKSAARASVVFGAVAFLFAAALAVRIYRLDKIPHGLHLDEGVYGLCALDILDGTDRPAYFNRLWGVDSLYAYLAAASFKISGAGVGSLRAVSAAAGAVTVVGVYLLASLLFGGAAGFFAAFMTAFSRWHINFSRISFQGVLLPAVTVFLFYFMFRAFESGKKSHYVAAGMLGGLGFYTYLPYRFVPLVVLFCVALKIFSDGKFFAKHRTGLAAAFASSAVVLIPLAAHFARYPEFLFARSAAVYDISSPLANLLKIILMFGVRGDMNPRHNIPGEPMLAFPAFLLFALGAILAASALVARRPAVTAGSAAVRPSAREAAAFLFAWFAALSLPSAFSADAPHALRTIGAVPPVFILSGYAAAFLYELPKRGLMRGLAARRALAAAAMLFVAYTQIKSYFAVWARRDDTRAAFFAGRIEIVRQTLGLSRSFDVYMPAVFFADPSTLFISKAEFPGAASAMASEKAFAREKPPARDAVYLLSYLSSADAGAARLLKKINPGMESVGAIRDSSGAPMFEYYRLPSSRARLVSSLSDVERLAVRRAAAAAIDECERTPWLRDQVKYLGFER